MDKIRPAGKSRLASVFLKIPQKLYLQKVEIANANRKKSIKVKSFLAAVRSSKILIFKFIFLFNLRNNVKYTIH